MTSTIVEEKNALIDIKTHYKKDDDCLEHFISLLREYVDEDTLDEYDISSLSWGYTQGYSRTDGRKKYYNLSECFDRGVVDDDCNSICFDIKKGYLTLNKGKIIKSDYNHLSKKTEEKFLQISILKKEFNDYVMKNDKANCNGCGKKRVIRDTIVSLRRSFKDRTKRDKPFKVEVKLCNKCYKAKVKNSEEIAKEYLDPELIEEYEGDKPSEGELIGIEAPYEESEETGDEACDPVELPVINIYEGEFKGIKTKKGGIKTIYKWKKTETFNFNESG